VEKGRGEDRRRWNNMIVQGRTVQEIMDKTGENSEGQDRTGRERTEQEEREERTLECKDRTGRTEQK
jgi:predicted RNase H-like nuclease (RuvC/YqgF family)